MTLNRIQVTNRWYHIQIPIGACPVCDLFYRGPVLSGTMWVKYRLSQTVFSFTALNTVDSAQ